MSLLTYSVTLTGGTTAKASDVESKFTSVANVVNGNLDDTNLNTLTGPLTWAIVSTKSAIVIASNSTTGQASFTQSADLAAGNSIVKIVGSAAIQVGDSLLRLDAQGATNTVPLLKTTNAGTGSNLDIQNAGILGSGKRGVSITSTTAQVNGDALLYVNLSGVSSTIPVVALLHAGTGALLTGTQSGVLASSTSAAKIIASGANTTGDSVAEIDATHASSTIPLLGMKNAGTGPFENFSDNSSNSLYQIDGTGSIKFAGATVPDWISNLGIKYASNTLSITGADGSALSATNPAYLTLQTTAGQSKTFRIASGPAFQGVGGTSAITGNLFGVTTGVAWATDLPFFLYAVLNSSTGTSVTFALSRNPCARTTPASNNAKAGGTGATLDTSFFFMDSSITLANYASSACVCLGSIRMQKATTADDWTIQALTLLDGIGQFHDQTPFVMPISQNGAATGKYFLNNGGTAPGFSVNTLNYFIRRTGIVEMLFYFKDSSGSVGSGSVNLKMSIPATSKAGGGFEGIYSDTIGISQSSGVYTGVCVPNNTGITFIALTLGQPFLLNTSYDNSANNLIAGKVTYKAFLDV